MILNEFAYDLVQYFTVDDEAITVMAFPTEALALDFVIPMRTPMSEKQYR